MHERYTHSEHYELLKGWLASRGMKIPHPDFFSDRGYVVNNVAAGFLYLTNSKQAFIADMVADPKAEMKQRDEALEKLFTVLLREAAEEGAKVVHAHTNLPAMRRRLEGLAFEPHGMYSVYFKELGRP